MTRLRPSSHPSARSASRKTSTLLAKFSLVLEPRMPTRRRFVSGCGSATSGAASTANEPVRNVRLVVLMVPGSVGRPARSGQTRRRALLVTDRMPPPSLLRSSLPVAVEPRAGAPGLQGLDVGQRAGFTGAAVTATMLTTFVTASDHLRVPLLDELASSSTILTTSLKAER